MGRLERPSFPQIFEECHWPVMDQKPSKESNAISFGRNSLQNSFVVDNKWIFNYSNTQLE